MEFTENLGLKKPGQDDFYDVDDFNYNAEILDKEVSGHAGTDIYSESGVHGIRYFDEQLEVRDKDGEWIAIEAGSSGLAPGDCTDISVKAGNGKLTIFWSDPEDITADGQVVCRWAGTKLVQKAGSYPKNPKDGVVLVNNQTRDAYKDNGFVVTGLQNNTTYYFTLFPYSDKNAVNISSGNRMTGTPQPYRKMTVKIDLSNSNPATCCTYADDAVDMVAGSDTWDEFFGHYPCLFKDGKEVGRLDRNDFTKFESGASADIMTGDAGDVMIAFPRRGLTINTVDDIVTVSMTDDPDNSDFEYNAHQRGATDRDVFYLGAYKGYVADGKLRSLTGKTPTTRQTIGTFRTQAQMNGSGYEQSGFYQLIFRQCMYLLKYKNLDSQSTIGMGYVLQDHTALTNTGGTESFGMDCKLIKQTNPTYMTDQNHHVKLFGIEDFWGNVFEWIDGCVTNSTMNILTGNDNFNNAGTGYIDNGQGATAKASNYMSKPQGSTKTGFVVKELAGSGTTYFCDYNYLYSSAVAAHGGFYNDAYKSGAFRFDLDIKTSGHAEYISARLMYL